MFASDRTLVLVIRWLVLAVAVWVTAEAVPGIHLDGWQSTLAVALILGLLNLYLRPILTLLTLPVTLLTLGLFILVINAILLGLTSWIASWFNIRFHVDSFFDALLGAIIISLVRMLIGLFVDAGRIARSIGGRRF